MITPNKYDSFEVVKGCTFNPALQLVEADGVTPLDLTGKRFLFEARTSLSATPPFMTLTTENGGITVDLETALVTMYYSEIATEALALCDTSVFGLKWLYDVDGIEHSDPLCYGPLPVVLFGARND